MGCISQPGSQEASQFSGGDERRDKNEMVNGGIWELEECATGISDCVRYLSETINSTLWDYGHEKRDVFAISGNMRLRLQSRALMVGMAILQEGWLAGIWHWHNCRDKC